MDSADFENSSLAIAVPRGLSSAQRVVIAVGFDAQAWALAVDDLDGVAFTGSDWVEHCLAGHARARGSGVQREVSGTDAASGRVSLRDRAVELLKARHSRARRAHPAPSLPRPLPVLG